MAHKNSVSGPMRGAVSMIPVMNQDSWNELLRKLTMLAAGTYTVTIATAGPIEPVEVSGKSDSRIVIAKNGWILLIRESAFPYPFNRHNLHRGMRLRITLDVGGTIISRVIEPVKIEGTPEYKERQNARAKLRERQARNKTGAK